MVDGSGHARIMDFGLATIVRDPSSVTSTSDGHGYSPRWTAPEVLRGAPVSKKSDVFSFAMVMYEVRAIDVRHSNHLIYRFRSSLGEPRTLMPYRMQPCQTSWMGNVQSGLFTQNSQIHYGN